MNPGVNDVIAAKFLRQDPAPAGERHVKVRVKTCSEGFATYGGALISCGDAPKMGADVPVAYGVCEIEMYPTHAARLEAEWVAKAPTKEEIEAAFRDLEGDLIDVGALSERKNHAIAPSRAEVIGALRRVLSGEVVGTTKKHYRPSWSASFLNANRREWPTVESVEIVSEEKPAPKR